MIAAGTWPLKKPSATEMFECFISKTTWFSYYRPGFTKVSSYPVMAKWLENQEDAPSALDAWEIEKPNYTFKDLIDFVNNDGVMPNKAGKRKAKDEGKVKEKTVPKKGAQNSKKRRTS
jgi:hypothetical protein